MNQSYGERPYSKRPDDGRISMHSKSSLSTNSSLPAQQSYSHPPAYTGQSLSANSGTRSHSCSSPGSSASSICSSGANLNAPISGEIYGYSDIDSSQGQPPPLINPKINSRINSGPNQNPSTVSYSSGVMSSPLSYSSVPPSTSSPSGSVSSSTDIGVPQSPTVFSFDPAYKSVLLFVFQRWESVKSRRSTRFFDTDINATSVSCFDDANLGLSQLPSSSSTSINRCNAPQNSMPVP